MLDALHVVVPMAIHQVGHHASGCLGQVGGLLLNDLVEGDALQDDDLRIVGREHEALHLALGLRQLFATRAVKVHFPYLATFDEGHGLVVQPLGIRLVVSVLCQLLLLAAVGIHHPQHLVALVLLHAVVAHLEYDVLAVGRGLIATNTTHGPECLGRHLVAGEFDGLFLDVHFISLFLCAAGRE